MSTDLEVARRRADDRAAFMERVRATLRQLVAESAPFDPFEHGTFLYQLRHEIINLLAEHGDPVMAERRRRRNSRRMVSKATRAKLFRRDDYTCRRCGFRSPEDQTERIAVNRSGRFLTADHIVPLCEGGRHVLANLQTLCSKCNPAKGKKLPDDPPTA